ncbi:MAG: App1 family protein [Haliscomenobacter sp.]
MLLLRHILYRLFHFVDQMVDTWRFKMVQVAGRQTNLPIKIATYRGFGRSDRIFLQGRVFIKKSIRNKPLQSAWQQLLDSYHRLNSSELPRAHLRIRFENHLLETFTDANGYFTLEEDIHPPLSQTVKHWISVHIELLSTPWGALPAKASTKILIPPPQADFGVITDIDDTIIHTGVTSLLKWEVVFNTIFKSPARRKVFKEVAAFFRALRQGTRPDGFNPIFYVSNSPRNFHSLVKKYLRIHRLPKGPLMLRDIGIPYKLHHRRNNSHKMDAILRILETYPQLPFILIGDSGEKDPYLYHEISTRLPGRIQAILIRDVKHIGRRKRLKPLLESSQTPAIQLFESYRQAALLAVSQGFMRQEVFDAFCHEMNPSGNA